MSYAASITPRPAAAAASSSMPWCATSHCARNTSRAESRVTSIPSTRRVASRSAPITCSSSRRSACKAGMYHRRSSAPPPSSNSRAVTPPSRCTRPTSPRAISTRRMRNTSISRRCSRLATTRARRAPLRRIPGISCNTVSTSTAGCAITTRVVAYEPCAGVKMTAYQLNFEHLPRYLHAMVIGENGPDNVYDYMVHVLQEYTRSGYERLLITEDLRGPRLTDQEVVEVLRQLAEAMPLPRGKVEYVDLAINATSAMALAIHIAKYKGIDIQRFSTIEAARAWLLACGSRAINSGFSCISALSSAASRLNNLR